MSVPTKANEYNFRGVALAEQGKYTEAIEQFLKAQILAPNAKTLYFLGLCYQRLDKIKDAIGYYEKAITAGPNFSMAYNNLGLIYFNQEDFGKALTYLKKAVLTDTNNVSALNNLANTYQKNGQIGKAIETYHQAINLAPDRVEPYNNLGIVYFEKGEIQNSLKYLQLAIGVNPKYRSAYYHLGIVQKKLELYDEAILNLEKAISLNPNHPESQALLGNLYIEKGNYDKALGCFQKALNLNPNFDKAYNDLANLFKKNFQFKEAIVAYQKAINLEPKLAGAYSNLGIVYSDLGNLDEALKYLKKALSVDPYSVEAYYHLAVVYEKMGKAGQARENLQRALEEDPNNNQALAFMVHILMLEGDWNEEDVYSRKLDELTRSELKAGKKPSEPPLLNIRRKEDLNLNLQVAQGWSGAMVKKIEPIKPQFDFSDRKQGGKIRVGYLSNDFYDHATAHLMLGLFGLHDRKKFEVYSYSYGPDDGSSYRKRIVKDSDRFVDIAKLGNLEAANKIYQDKIDILVDLKGYTRDTRLEIAAYHPAPVQVAYLGFPGTSGAMFFDYILTDKIISPPDTQKYYTEKFAYLPDCYQVNDDQQPISKQSVKRSDFKLPPNKLVFASFNRTDKIDQATFLSWMRILKRVPKSVLWLLASDGVVQNRFKTNAKKLGIDPKRLIFTKKLPKDKHLKRIQLADLCLDTFIYNGHTTTSDSLWAGVPVVTLQGKHFASRVSSSLLAAIGLPELITHSQKEYETLAVNLSTKTEKLASVRQTLSQYRLTSPLFDTKRFTKNLENLYEAMWDNYLKGGKPKGLYGGKSKGIK
jgi:protein O-GlcNAc transferase